MTTGHAQGDGTRPTARSSSSRLSTSDGSDIAQSYGSLTGPPILHAGSRWPVKAADAAVLFVSINPACTRCCQTAPSSLVRILLHPAMPSGSGYFQRCHPASFAFDFRVMWRAAGDFQQPATITGVAGISRRCSCGRPGDGRNPVVDRCGTCHASPNVGNHQFHPVEYRHGRSRRSGVGQHGRPGYFYCCNHAKQLVNADSRGQTARRPAIWAVR